MAPADFDPLSVIIAQRYIADQKSNSDVLTPNMASLRERRQQFQDSLIERQAMEAAKKRGCCQKAMRSLKLWFKDFSANAWLNDFPLLLGSVRKIEGNFGSGVGSYFRFLRWMILLNLVLGVVWVGLTVVPDIVDTSNGRNREAHITAGSLIFGDGLENTWIFYGGYVPQTEFLDAKYDMALAYALAVAAMFAISLVTIINRIFLERSLASTGSSVTGLYTKTFLSQQDFSVTNQSTQSVLTNGCAQQLRINIAEDRAAARIKSRQGNTLRIFVIVLRRTFGAVVTLGVFALSVFCTIKIFQNADYLDSKFEFAVPLLLVMVKQGMPIIMTQAILFEGRESIADILQTTVGRVYIFKIFTLMVLFWEIYKEVEDGNFMKGKEDACVETEVAKIFYETMTMDMLLTSVQVVVEAVGKLKYYGELQVFDHELVGNNVIDLMYRQAMVWCGAIVCPVLCLWGCVMNIVIFMVQRSTYLRTHRPPERPWGASDSNKFFLYLLLLTLAISAVPAGKFLIDSKQCGPFVNLTAPIDAFRDVVRSSSTLQEILKYVTNQWILIAVIVATLLGLRLLYTDLKTYKREVHKLQDHCKVEREEKESLVRRCIHAGMTKEELGRNRKKINLVEELKKNTF